MGCRNVRRGRPARSPPPRLTKDDRISGGCGPLGHARSLNLWRVTRMSPVAQRPSMSAADWLLLAGLSLLWGGSFFFAKIAVLELPPLTVALGRVALAAAILLTLARGRRVALPGTLAAWRPYALMGLLN